MLETSIRKLLHPMIIDSYEIIVIDCHYASDLINSVSSGRLTHLHLT